MELSETDHSSQPQPRKALSPSHTLSLVITITLAILAVVHEYRPHLTGTPRTPLHFVISLLLFWAFIFACLYTLTKTRRITATHVAFLCTAALVVSIYNVLLFQPSRVETLGTRLFTAFFIGYELLQIAIGLTFVCMLIRTPRK